jgi:hypothetical protein
MWPAVETEQVNGTFLLLFDDQSQGVGTRCADFQSVLHRVLQGRE